MLTQSHLFIAKKISEELGQDLNHNYFYLGNIAPDFIPYHKKKEHVFKSSFSYLLNEIDSIDKMADMNLISFRMGIITHYLADFFCKAHNNENLIKNLWHHFQYESLLHRVLISTKHEVQIDKDILNLEKYLKGKHESYLLQESSVVTDILYSTEVCQAIVYYILLKVNTQIVKAA